MPSLHESTYKPEVAKVLEYLRQKLATTMGVSLVGNRLTLRWYAEGELVDVHMIISEVGTPSESRKLGERDSRMVALFKKYPGLRDELAYAETGETEC